MENLETEVKNMIAEILETDPAKISPDARLVEDLGMDSIMALEILVALEKKYKIAIPEEKLPEIKTVNAAIAIAREYLQAKEQDSAA
jgi:acyl carrier protein